MPVTTTYPGVYVSEIPSGVRTITGVATSITAFIGRTLRGPTDEPISISSYADFERRFGGLWAESSLGYAVRDFYRNGGSQAVIVRLFGVAPPPPPADPNAPPAPPPVAPHASLVVSGITLEAQDPGSWGNQLRARIDWNVRPAPGTSTPDPDLFNLAVRDGQTGQVELIRNVSAKEGHPRHVTKVLLNESRLVQTKGAVPTGRPGKQAELVTGQTDIWSDTKTDGTKVDPPSSIAVAADGPNKGTVDDGVDLGSADFIGPNMQTNKKGLYALEKADLFNILCIPPYLDDDVEADLIAEAAVYCEQRRSMILIDPRTTWIDKDTAKNGIPALGTLSKNAAVFFPRLRQPDPMRENQVGDFVPCGAVAGIFARTDTNRGVWKAPAGLDATLVGVPELAVPLTDGEIGELNPRGINALRSLPAAGRVVWGARTLQGNDQLASEWKYIPVRRTALYIEESLYRGTQWVVFEPNDEPLWSQIRLNLGAFMQNLFRQGAFQGKTPADAYFVKCDKETTTQNDIDLGIVNIVVGFAPLKPAEFVILQIQQIAGQIQA